MQSPVIYSLSPRARSSACALRAHALDSHLASPLIQSTRHNTEDAHGNGYRVVKAGMQILCGGLLTLLRARFYPHHKDNRSRRAWKTTRIKGSSKVQGIRVDTDLAAYTAGTMQFKKMHPMARAVVEHLRERGQELYAAQVPVEVELGRMTQADMITYCAATDTLHLYELKTGCNNLHRKQGTFAAAPYTHVDCTKLNIWNLQLEFTRAAFERAGVVFADAHVIQVYEEKVVSAPAPQGPELKRKRPKAVIKIKLRPQPDWVRPVVVAPKTTPWTKAKAGAKKRAKKE